MANLKTINVSLQSKRYAEPINKIIAEWKADGLNVSTEVCESILLKNKVDKSATLLQVLSALDLVEKLLKIKGIEDTETVEKILKRMININMNGLTDSLTDLEEKEKPISKPIENQSLKIEKKESSKEENTTKEIVKPKMEYNNMEIEIPSDFLMND